MSARKGAFSEPKAVREWRTLNLNIAYRLEDAARRVDFNAQRFLKAQPQFERTQEKVRSFAYADFLSSVYSMRDLLKAADNKFQVGDFLKVDHYVRNDQLLSYAINARNQQDHTLDAAGLMPVTKDLGDRVLRGEFTLYPLSGERGSPPKPLPSRHRDQELPDLFPELVVILVASWWLTAFQYTRDLFPFALPKSLDLAQLQFQIDTARELADENAAAQGKYMRKGLFRSSRFKKRCFEVI